MGWNKILLCFMIIVLLANYKSQAYNIVQSTTRMMCYHTITVIGFIYDAFECFVALFAGVTVGQDFLPYKHLLQQWEALKKGPKCTMETDFNFQCIWQ